MPSVSWAQIEKLSLAYLQKSGTVQAANLDKCLKHAADFAEKVSAFFIRHYNGLEEASVSFCLSTDGTYPDWACQYDEESKTFMLNAVGIMSFVQSCNEAPELILTPEGRGNGNFSVYRLNAYKAELRKLPSQMMMFLLLFQEVARVLDVTTVERRRNSARHVLEKTDTDYMNLLWAFRKVDGIYTKFHGIDMKSDIKFTWHESEWATGKG